MIPGDFLKEKIYDASSTGNKYDSYDFHDAVDEKGLTGFIIECCRGYEDRKPGFEDGGLYE